MMAWKLFNTSWTLTWTYPPTFTILCLKELVLTLSNFTFKEKNYIQRKDASMGQKVGPSYACLFKGFLEKKFLASYQDPNPDHLNRYIDDFIGISTNCSENDITNFIEAFNKFHPSIKPTYSISKTSLPYHTDSFSGSNVSVLTPRTSIPKLMK